jgi:DNA replication protein
MALNNSQYNVIIRAYQKKQLNSKHELDKRYAEVYKAIPELEILEQQIADIAVKKARNRLFDGDKNAIYELKEEFKIIGMQKEELLKKGGYNLYYLEPQHECSDCKDTGYAEGKKCHCFRQAEIELLYTQSNIKTALLRENFDTLKYDYYDNKKLLESNNKTQLENMKVVIEKCKDFAENFDSEFKNILFTGTTGSGKTFLSNCIAQKLIINYKSVIYLSSMELFDLLSKNRFGKDEASEYTDMYEHIFECDLLIIDDLGTELTNSFTISELFFCINERLIRRNSTIISTNLSLGSLRDIYSERVVSRIISEYDIMTLCGEDIRIQKRIKT